MWMNATGKYRGRRKMHAGAAPFTATEPAPGKQRCHGMMNRLRSTRHDWVRSLGIVPVVLALCVPAAARGQLTKGDSSVSMPGSVHPERFYPDLRKGREITLAGVGSGIMGTALLLPAVFRDVPAQGFDPAGIVWGVDRNIVGNRSLDANATSDWTRNAAVVFPLVLAWATGQPGERWSEFGRSSSVYAETFLISRGLTNLGKATLRRSRPFTYLSLADRPQDSAYDVSRERAFRSMPSGHAASAWTGATLGMMEHLLRRPEASWVERAGVGFLGGALAGSTSALRVAAGQHFPSDVLAGAGIGLATGVTVPLLHRGKQPLPSSKAWLAMVGGALAGTLVGVLVAQGY
ncbi:MAG: hypothetical protein BMS9Abin29_1765 [Gemmatimonadota bacterium]|nr:MAG: hypothetical protein BMS9Abin29_1765 [Gemmatimonadota bacterium]